MQRARRCSAQMYAHSRAFYAAKRANVRIPHTKWSFFVFSVRDFYDNGVYNINILMKKRKGVMLAYSGWIIAASHGSVHLAFQMNKRSVC